MKKKYIGTQLNKFSQIVDLSKSNKLSAGFKMELYNVLRIIEIKQRNKIKSHLFWKKFFFSMQKEIITAINKKINPNGNAEGRKNIPIRNKTFPIFRKLLFSNLKPNVFINFIKFITKFINFLNIENFQSF